MKFVLVEEIEGDYESPSYDLFHTFELEGDVSLAEAKALFVKSLTDCFNKIAGLFHHYEFKFFNLELSSENVLSTKMRKDIIDNPELLEVLVFQDLVNVRILTLDEWFEENRII